MNVASERVKEQNLEEEAVLTVGTKQVKSGESELFLRAQATPKSLSDCTLLS